MNIVNLSLMVVSVLVIGLAFFFNHKRKEQQHAERRWMDGGVRESQEDIIVGDIGDDYFGDEVGEVRIVEPSFSSETSSLDEENIIIEEPVKESVKEQIEEPVEIEGSNGLKERETQEQQEMDFSDFSEDEVTKPLAGPKSEPIVSAYETTIVLTVMAPEEDAFEGADLLREFTAQNLILGKDGFYHRPVPGLANEYLFSVANVMEPGTLHTSEMIQLTTKGLLLFMHLPNKLTPVQAFEQFYDTADGLAVTLNGVVCDQQRNILNEYRLDQMRDDMQHLALKLDVEAKQK